MAVTVTNIQAERVPGAERRTVKKVKLGETYKTGGISVTPTNLGLHKVVWADCALIEGTGVAEKWVNSPYYDATNKKIKLQDAKTGKELAEGTETTPVEVLVVAYGF